MGNNKNNRWSLIKKARNINNKIIIVMKNLEKYYTNISDTIFNYDPYKPYIKDKTYIKDHKNLIYLTYDIIKSEEEKLKKAEEEEEEKNENKNENKKIGLKKELDINENSKISEYIHWYPNTDNVKDLTPELQDELTQNLLKYRKYYSSIKDEKPTLSILTELDHQVRYGTYKTEDGTDFLGFLSKDDYDKPIELLRRRRMGLIKCKEIRKDDNFYNDALDEERKVIPDEELGIGEKLEIDEKNKIEIIQRATRSIRWGDGDFIKENSCENEDNLIRTIRELNDYDSNKTLEFHKKTYIFGYSKLIQEYRKCFRYIRSLKQKNKININNCSPYVEWQPILNKMYTYFSSKTNLHFPVCFILDKDEKYPKKSRDPETIEKIFNNNKFIGIISIPYKEDRYGKEYSTRPKCIFLYIFLKDKKEKNYIHNIFNNFIIYNFSKIVTDIGYIFKTNNITYDEFNIFVHYLGMNTYLYDNNKLFLTYKKDEEIQNILTRINKNKNNTNKIKLERVLYKKSDSVKGFSRKITQEGGKNNTIKNTIKIKYSKKFTLYDTNISNKIYNKFLSYFVCNLVYSNNLLDIHKTSSDIFPYSFIINNNIQYLTTYDIKRSKSGRIFTIKSLLGEKCKTYSIVKYNPINIKFFENIEIIMKFPILQSHKQYDILEISQYTSFLESCFYYEKKYKNNTISNYNLLYPTKYQYSTKKLSDDDSIEALTFLFANNVQVEKKDTYFDTKYIFSSNKKYDIISSSITSFYDTTLLFENKNIPLFFTIFCYAINHLSKNGSFIFIVNNITTKAVVDIILLGKKYFFEKVDLYKPKIYNNYKFFGTSIIFQNFKGLDKDINNSLKKVFDSIYTYDKTLKNFNIKDPKIRKEYKLDNYQFETTLNKSFEYKYIQQFLTIPSTSEEYNFIREFNENIYKEKLEALTKTIEVYNMKPKEKEIYLEEIKKQQLIQSYLYAKEFDLDTWINDISQSKEDVMKILLEDMFSHTNNILEKLDYVSDDAIDNIEIPEDFIKLQKNIDMSGYTIDTRNINLYNKVKKEIRLYKPTFPNKEVTNSLRLTNQVSKITKIHSISQAWLKMYEILTLCNLFSKYKPLKTFHICEAPGNFISAIEYYVKHKTKIQDFTWNAQSLDIRKAQIKDTYQYIKKNPNKWDFAPDKSGDITKLTNIQYYGEKYCKDVSLITSDCGIEFDLNNPNSLDHMKLYYSQSLFILLNLPKGGTFVAKYFFPIVSNLEISILYLYYEHFDEVIFYKPLQNYQSKEFYIIGKKYTPVSTSLQKKLIEFHKKMKKDSIFIKDFPENFLLQLLHIQKLLSNNWIKYIDRQIFYSDHYEDITEKDKKIIKLYIQKKNTEWLKRFRL